ncbi:pancreatic progenitor cell differentiation and proliferation factor-like protein [Pterocles gutturalis]
MASVPSAGCLLAKKQFYRTRQNSESSVSSSSSCCSDAVNVTEQDKAFNGLPELIDNCWWIKSFFHSEPSLPTVGRKTLSASRYCNTKASFGLQHCKAVHQIVYFIKYDRSGSEVIEENKYLAG